MRYPYQCVYLVNLRYGACSNRSAYYVHVLLYALPYQCVYLINFLNQWNMPYMHCLTNVYISLTF